MAEVVAAKPGLSATMGAGVQRDPVRVSEKTFLYPADVYFKNRARDSGAPPGPPAYVFWITTNNTTDPYPNAPPFGGPLVERVAWQLE